MLYQRLQPEPLLLTPTAATDKKYYDSIPSQDEEDLLSIGNRGGYSNRYYFEEDPLLPRRHHKCHFSIVVAVLFSSFVVVLIALRVMVHQHYDYYGSGIQEDNYSWTEVLPTVPFMGTPMRHTLLQQQANEAGSKKLLRVGTTKKEEDLKAPPGCEGTVLIVPPCEKGSLKEQCDYIGYERAAYLATLFGPGHERYPQPSYLIAESPVDRRDINRKNVREMETITPLADKFGLDIDTRFSTLDMNDFQSYVHKLFQNGDMCGKLMVISWKHVKIPRLANAIGCGPREGCPLDYPNSDQFTDAILQIKLVHRKHSPMEEGYLQVTKNREWLVFGSVQQQGFDPLSFSKKSGNYPVGGTPNGGRWVANDDKDVY